jgi:hypothetical protein
MQIWRSEIGYGANRSRTYRYASSVRHRLLRYDTLLRFRDDKPASIPNCDSIRASRPAAIVGRPHLLRLVLRSHVKQLRPRAALTVDFLTSRRSGLLWARNGLLWFYGGSVSLAAQEGRDIENVFLDRIAHTRGAAIRIEVLRSRMARIYRSPFGVADRRAERRTL